MLRRVNPLTITARQFAFTVLHGGFAFVGTLGAAGCAPSVSQQPLTPEADGAGYFYGAPLRAGKQLEEAPAQASPITQAPRAKQVAAPEPPAEEENAKASSTEETQADASVASPALDRQAVAQRFEGEYSGKDIVTIQFEGLPPQTQEDENAQMKVAVDDDQVSLTVVDSSSGNDLCTVTGQLPEQLSADEAPRVTFPAGQRCFSDMLGGPISAELIGGEASVEEATLTVNFDVRLELNSPNASLSGSLEFEFVGERN